MSPSCKTSVIAALTLASFGVHAAGGADRDGAGPTGPLLEVRSSDGATLLYGVTTQGGRYNLGTVFRINPRGEEQVLYSFAGGRRDGATPMGTLVRGPDDSLYGATSAGGNCGHPEQNTAPNDCGTLFRIAPDGSVT